MRDIILVLFLLVIINPYDGLDYEEINVYIIEEEDSYSIKTYGPEKDSNITEFTDEETNRFIKKIDRIINYPPFVYQSSQVIDF